MSAFRGKVDDAGCGDQRKPASHCDLVLLLGDLGSQFGITKANTLAAFFGNHDARVNKIEAVGDKTRDERAEVARHEVELRHTQGLKGCPNDVDVEAFDLAVGRAIAPRLAVVDACRQLLLAENPIFGGGRMRRRNGQRLASALSAATAKVDRKVLTTLPLCPLGP